MGEEQKGIHSHRWFGYDLGTVQAGKPMTVKEMGRRGLGCGGLPMFPKNPPGVAAVGACDCRPYAPLAGRTLRRQG